MRDASRITVIAVMVMAIILIVGNCPLAVIALLYIAIAAMH